MMAAIAAAREGAKVTVLEGMEKPGKKLLVTGNGRCNLTNLDPDLPEKYYCVEAIERRTLPADGSKSEMHSTGAIVRNVLEQFSVNDTLDFFHKLGLRTMNRNGYVYPYTNQAVSVLDLLLAELKRLKVKLKFTEKIEKIEKEEAGWKVVTGTWTYSCDTLILCCGSKAAKNTGSDGSGYELARQTGHTLTSVVPSLTALTGKGNYFSSCAGVRCPANVTLYVSKTDSAWQKKATDFGEIQWTDQGISGIVVFQVSRFASLALEKGEKVKAELDLLPDMTQDDVMEYLMCGKTRFPNASAAETFSGLLPKKLLAVCLDMNKIKPGTPSGNLTEEHCTRLTETMKRFTMPITGVRSFDQCQVCAGGVMLDEIDENTLESKRVNDLYFAGELLDVDGPCGGYNLQWAWSSGYVAGIHAAAE